MQIKTLCKRDLQMLHSIPAPTNLTNHIHTFIRSQRIIKEAWEIPTRRLPCTGTISSTATGHSLLHTVATSTATPEMAPAPAVSQTSPLDCTQFPGATQGCEDSSNTTAAAASGPGLASTDRRLSELNKYTADTRHVKKFRIC